MLIPNSTQIPNGIIDKIIPFLSKSELNCLVYICRRTFGFQKSSDKISFTQFENGIKTREGKILDRGTGLSRARVSDGLRGLIDIGIVLVDREGNTNEYKIDLDFDVEKWYQKETSIKKKLVSKRNRTSIIRKPKLVSKRNIQKKEKQSYQNKVYTPSKNSLLILKEWNSFKRTIKHKEFRDDWQKDLDKLLEKRTLKEVLKGIKVYGGSVGGGKIDEPEVESWFKHRWTLEEFIKRKNGCIVFMEKEVEDYKKDKSEQPETIILGKK